MRCYCCNDELNDFEATRRSSITGGFLDVCNGCFHHMREEICAVERTDLRHEDDDVNEETYEDI